MNHNKILRFLGIALLVIAVWLTALTIVLGSPALVMAFLIVLVLFFTVFGGVFLLVFVYKVKE